MNVVRQIIKDMGLDFQQLQSDGKLKAAEIKEEKEVKGTSPMTPRDR